MSDKPLFNASPPTTLSRSVEHASAGPTNEFTLFARKDVEQSIPARFQQQASKYPDRIAVKGRNHTFTYDALNRYSNRIARAILALERDREEVIGLFFEKDAPLMAALLGVLKAGKIYVSLDPSQPCARALKMLEDAQASLVIADEQNLAPARELASGTRRLLCVPDLDSKLSEENLSTSIPPDALAYIIYTSGSTGEPKGVVQTHRNVLHNIWRHTNSSHYCAEDRLTLLASCGTGQAATDIYGALLNGATLCPFGIKEEGLLRLASWLREEEITVFHSSASVFRYFLEGLDSAESYRRLRLIKLGSEQVLKSDVDSYKKQFSPRCLLANTLSASEAGPLRQLFIDKQTSIHKGVVPVGFPVEDMEVLLLDDSGDPVGLDCPGEIVIKSRYLAPGYWRRPELTNATFLPDPLGGDERLFRTGDLGRMAADGCMEYLGRKDLQVKIRGFRVELAEVEAALLELGTIKQAAVVVSEDQRGEKSLTAYGVPAVNPVPSVASLRSSLREKLPEHMIPSEFILLKKMPLSPSGKLDRSSLSSSIPRNNERHAAYLPPLSPLEWQIVNIWEELLGVRPVGVHDDFFALGGHSLLAVRMMDRIEELCSAKLPLTALLAGATVEHLATCVLGANRETFRTPLVAVQTEGSSPPFFLLHGDFNGGGFYCRNLARYLGNGQPLYTLAPHGLNEEAIPDSIEEMAADRLSALLEFQPTGPFLLGGHCNGGLVALEMARQLKSRGLQVDLLVMIDAFALNAQFRWLRRFVFSLGWVLQADRTRQLHWFKKLRFYCIRWREISSLGARAQVSYAARKIVKSTKTLGSPSVPVGQDLATEVPPSPDSMNEKRFARYHTVIDSYVPEIYDGSVVFFRSQAMQSRAPVDPTAGWGKVAKDVEVHWLPGDHLTCLSEHLVTLAEHLASCLGEASASPKLRYPASSGERPRKSHKG